MEIICAANEGILSILKRFRKTAEEYRLTKYCVQTPVEEGVLLLNTLTRELVLLTPAEYEDLFRMEELKERWFLVPRDTNEKELAGLVRWVLESRQKKPEHITGYTIFPTTDCNARCFYCFELGRSRIPMSRETAEKTVAYIKDHCGGKKVSLSWFGGEPLYNQPAIDTICDGLRRAGIEYTSRMISNGYLFDTDAVKKAVECWNLKRVQITLDGTEAVYNRSKAFIYREGSAYQVVLANIARLMEAGIRVTIRLNLDLYNAENLMELVAELAGRFENKDNLSVYAQLLFDSDDPEAAPRSDEEMEERDKALQRLEEELIRLGLSSMPGIRKNLKLSHCMADGGRSVTILPTGDIGLCENFTETEFIGHMDREGFDKAAVSRWKERTADEPACDDCFYYPECILLKKCPNQSKCHPRLRREHLRWTQRQMVNEYRYRLHKGSAEIPEDEEIC